MLNLVPVGYNLIMTMWGKHAQPAIQIFGLGWSIGGIFGPLLAVPFVGSSSSNSSINDGNRTCVEAETSSAHIWSVDPQVQSNDRYPDDSRIEVSFWIISVVTMFVSAMFVAVYIGFKPQAMRGAVQQHSWNEILKPSGWSHGEPKFGIKVLTLFIVAFVFHTGLYNGTTMFLAAYAYDSDLCFDKQEAALLASVFNLAGSTGRVIVVATAKWHTATPLLAVLIHGALSGGVLMLLVGTRSQTGLWWTSFLFALFYRPVWGALYIWANNYITLMATLISFQMVVNAITYLFIATAQGILYVRNVDTIFYTTIFYASLLSITYYLMVCVGWGRNSRHEKPQIISTVEIECKVMEEKPSHEKSEKIWTRI